MHVYFCVFMIFSCVLTLDSIFRFLTHFVVLLILALWRQFCCSTAISRYASVMVEHGDCLMPLLCASLNLLVILTRMSGEQNCVSSLFIYSDMHLYFLPVRLRIHLSLPMRLPTPLSSPPICLLFALVMRIYPCHLPNCIPNYSFKIPYLT